MTAIRSFHRITNDENGLARQAHVRIATAQPGDDSASLATRMTGVSEGLDTFLILNGLERDSAIPAGQRFKIVAP
jgi:predicted Zn-dependent protease